MARSGRCAWWTLAAALAWVATAAARASAAPSVGDAGDVARIEFVGNERIASADLRAALRQDIGFQLASTPSAPMDAFVDYVPKAVASGYRSDGYSEVQVSAALDAAGKALRVNIVEGPRRVAGAVKLVGAAEALDARRLADDLMAPQAPVSFRIVREAGGALKADRWSQPTDPDRAIWETGKPKNFTEYAEKALSDAAGEAMARQGYFKAKFTVEAEPAGERVNLLIRVADVGPSAVVGKVELRGATRNAPADVLALLDVKIGRVIDATALRGMQQKLWDSGRFWNHTVTLVPDPASPVASGRMTLWVEVVEHPRATPLGRPLAREEQAVLKFREWVVASLKAGKEFSGEARSDRWLGSLAVSPRDGVLAETRLGPAPALESREMPDFLARLNLGLRLTGRQLTIYDLAGGRRYAFEIGAGTSRAAIQMTLVTTGDPEQPQAFLIGGGLDNKRKGDAPPLHFQFEFAPVCFIDMPLAEGTTTSWSGGELRIKRERGTMRVDAATGRLIDLTTTATPAGGGTAHVTMEDGALARITARLDAETRPVAEGPGRGAERLLSLIATAGFDGRFSLAPPAPVAPGDLERRRAAIAAVERLGTPEVLAEVSKLYGLIFPKTPDFKVQPDVKMIEAMVARSPLVAWTMMLVPGCDEIFARGSWPWTIAREYLFMAGGTAPNVMTEHGRLYRANDIGPVGYLALARLIGPGDPALGRIFAKRGLELATPEGFAKDVAGLLDANVPAARILAGLVRATGRLTDAEADSLAAALPADVRPVLIALVKAQRARANEVGGSALTAEGRRALWEWGLGAWVTKALSDLAAAK